MTTANIETNHGKISFELLPDLAPETVRNFEKLAKDGFYDGTLSALKYSEKINKKSIIFD